MLNDGGDGHSFTSVLELFRKGYFEVIDSSKSDPKKWLKQKNFIFVQKLETLLLDRANGRPVTPPEQIIDIYERDINMQKFKFHFQLLPDVMLLDGILIREVTQVQIIFWFETID